MQLLERASKNEVSLRIGLPRSADALNLLCGYPRRRRNQRPSSYPISASCVHQLALRCARFPIHLCHWKPVEWPNFRPRV